MSKKITIKKESSTSLAKIACPQLEFYYPRQRLFDKLNQVESRPVVWVSAPAGSGKTLLLASYCKYKKIKALCYRLDLRDADLASFFYYLREAAIRLSDTELESLSLLTPEYMLGEQVFAYNFFEQLFNGLKKPAYLIFDNYQDVPESSPLHHVLADICKLIPENVRLFFLSRSVAPREFSGLLLKQRIAEINTADLKLSLEETQGIVKLHNDIVLTLDEVQKLQKLTQGWIAGVILSLAQMEKGCLEKEIINESLFDFFSAEVFDRTDKITQNFLLNTAVLPQIPLELAAKLSDQSDAERILYGLSKNNFFTLRLFGNPTLFEYHPLFRSYLLNRVKQEWSAEKLAKHQKQVAKLLLNHEWIEEAAQLYIDSQDYAGLMILILQNAPRLFPQGRYLTLSNWISALPDQLRKKNPWILYWQATSQAMFNPIAARELFNQAYLQFDETADARGIFLSWSGAVNTFAIVWDDFKPLQIWVERLETQLQRFGGYPDDATEQQVILSVLFSVILADPLHPRVKEWLIQAENIIRTDGDMEIQAHTASYLGLYYAVIGDFDHLHEIEERLLWMKNTHQLMPLTQILSSVCIMSIQWISGNSERALQTGNQTLAYTKQHGIHILDGLIISHMVYANFASGNLEKAKHYIESSYANLRKDQRLSFGHYHYQMAWLNLMESNFTDALFHIQTCRNLTEDLGCLLPNVFNQVISAQILIELQRVGETEVLIADSRKLGLAMNSDLLVFSTGLISAYQAIKQNKNQKAEHEVRQALSIGKKRYYSFFPGWTNTLMATVLSFALTNNIEVDYAQELIKQRKIRPLDPMNAGDNWNWPVKIYTLGRFSVVVNNEVLIFPGKGKSKQLELLKVLIAFGGRNVGEEKLADCLWSDAEGDVALGNLHTTLYRLRKLLGHHETIIISQGQVSINEQLCWLDMWELGRLLLSVQEVDQSSAGLLVERILKLYQGEFLEKESLCAWAIDQRERLDRKVRFGLQKLGEQLNENKVI